MIYGLTGGMGAGKSMAASILKAKGYTVLNADEISHEVTKKGSPLLRLLVKEFGIEIIKENGELDRRKLAEIAFNDREKTRRLNDLVQSAVLVRTIEKVSLMKVRRRTSVIFFEVPLLFEAGWGRLVDKIWLVTAPREIRVKRIIERDNLSVEEISARLKLQMSEEEKMKLADVVIDNSGDLEELARNVDKALATL